jgi:hypothetical protein
MMIACAVAALVATRAQAQIVLDNLAPGGPPAAQYKNYANISRWAQEFTATATGLISDVKLNLYRTNTQSGAFTVEIWSDAGTIPGTSQAVLKTLDWSNVALNDLSAPTHIISFENNITLASGTTYWLVVSQASNGPAAKRWAINGSGIGNTASYSGTTWTSVGTTLNLGAQITVGSAIPEPSTYALIVGISGLSFSIWVRSRKRKPARES